VSCPPVEPYAVGELAVGDGHRLYWETVGDPGGVPAVWLHGGPGSGSSAGARRYFDPGGYRAVLFDQRGCGRSRPLADGPDVDLTVNTTDHLVADLERLRSHLGIDRWVVAGVSWGVTLALVYAQAHPHRVSAMMLAAVTTGTHRETGWITRDMGRVFPGQWDQFLHLVPESDRGSDLAAAYAALLANPDPALRDAAASAWCAWEDTHVSLMPSWAPNPRYQDPAFRQVFARLVTHYWSHGCFLSEDQIMGNVSRLHDIPAVLIHGRYDISGPLDTAWALHRSWPTSQLVVVDDAGHGGGSFPERITAALDTFSTVT